MSLKDLRNVVIPPKIAGIKTTMPDYKLAWHINNSFKIGLALNLDWNKKLNEGKHSSHRHYFCHFEDVELNWHLIQNKGSAAYFFQSRPVFDYLLICNGEDIYNYFERAVGSIKTNRKIENIFPFNFELLPQKDNFYSNILDTKYFLEDFNV